MFPPAAAGPSHAPHFECTVKVRGWEFSGNGSTKKQAKTAAAEAALKYLHDVHSIDALTGKDPATLGDDDPLKMGKSGVMVRGWSLMLWLLPLRSRRGQDAC